MQDAGLARRFLADWPAPFTPQAELVYEGPRRQRELIAIGRQQLEAQRSAAKTIARSNIAAADIIANEISQQTAALEASLRDYSNRVSSSVMDAADQMSAAIEVLGDRLCAYLGEIRWQLAQQGETLAGILRALRESRSNEARQLVEQGVRHYINEQYERAEERFRQALMQDTTDYQVLMNLGLIAVQNGLSAEAFEFFKDALRLPSALDRPSKNRALLTIARLHYAKGEYRDALVNARQAATVADTSQVDEVFVLGTYAALAGHVSECLDRLDEAIRIKPALFGKAAVDPNLEASRPDVLTLLSRLALEAREHVSSELRTARELLSRVGQHAESSVVIQESTLAAKALDDISRATLRASYDDLLRLRSEAENVTKSINLISAAEVSAANKRAVERPIPALADAANAAERELQLLHQVPPFKIRSWFLWHLGTWLPITYILTAQAQFNRELVVWAGLFTGGWFWVGMPVWAFVQHLSEKHAESVDSAHAQHRTVKSQAASAARSASTKAISEARTHDERCKALLADARSLTENRPVSKSAQPTG